MNTIDSILTIAFLIIVSFTGFFYIFNSFASNSNLDADSRSLMSNYTIIYTNVSSSNTLDDYNASESNYDQVDAFYRASAEDKGTWESFKDKINLVYRAPSIIFLPFGIPNTYINWFLVIIYSIISMLVVIAGYKFLKGVFS